MPGPVQDSDYKCRHNEEGNRTIDRTNPYEIWDLEYVLHMLDLFIYIYICVCVYVWYCLYNLYIWCSLAFCIHIPYTPILLAYFSAFCRCQRLTSISSTSRPLAEFDVKSPWCASIFPILSEISHDLTWLSWFQCFRCFRQMNLRIRFLQNRLRACWQRADNMSRMSRMSCGEQRRMCPIRYHCSHQAGEGRPKDRRETEGNSFRTENARAKAI